MKHARRLFGILALALFAQPAGATVTILDSSEGTGTTSLSWSSTVTSNQLPDGVLIFCFSNGSASDTFTGAGYGTADNATRIHSAADSAGETGFVEVYYKAGSMGSGIRTVSCTVTGTGTYYGVAITLETSSNRMLVPVGTACGAEGDTANPSCTITGFTGDVFLATGLHSGHDAPASIVGAAPTSNLIQTNDYGLQSAAVYSTTGAQSSGSTAWTATSEDVAMVSVAVQELTTAPGGVRFTDIGPLGTATCSASTTCAVTTTATLEVGNLAICSVSKDEAGADIVDGALLTEITSLTGTGGNTWTQVGEYCNVETASVADGQCVGAFYTRATNQVSSGGTLTVTFEASTARSAVTCREFGVSGPIKHLTESTVSLPRGNAADNTDPPSLGFGVIGDAGEHLYYRVDAMETNVTYYPSTNNGACAPAISNSGTAATSSEVACEYAITHGRYPYYWEQSSYSSSANNPATNGNNDSAQLLFIITDALQDNNRVTNQGQQ